jgi:ABC-2 type transport system ATP-binding protein
VVVVSRGRLVRQGTLAELGAGPRAVLVRTPQPEALRDALPGQPVEQLPDGRLRVSGSTTEEVGHALYLAGVEVHELVAEAGDLERLFLDLTAEQPATVAS